MACVKRSMAVSHSLAANALFPWAFNNCRLCTTTRAWSVAYPQYNGNATRTSAMVDGDGRRAMGDRRWAMGDGGDWELGITPQAVVLDGRRIIIAPSRLSPVDSKNRLESPGTVTVLVTRSDGSKTTPESSFWVSMCSHLCPRECECTAIPMRRLPESRFSTEL